MNPSAFRKFSGIEKKMEERGLVTILSRIFYVSQCRKFSLENPSLCEKNFGFKKFYGWKGWVSRFSVEKFWSHSAENFLQRILLFLREKLVWNIFMDEKGVSRFSVELFWSHSAEKFRGHPFNVSETLGYRKILCIIRISHFSVPNFFCLTVSKTFVRESQCFWESFRFQKFYGWKRGYHVFP